MINRNRWTCGLVLAILAACVMGLVHPIFAQQGEQAPPTAKPEAQTPPKPSTDSGDATSKPATDSTSKPAPDPDLMKNDRIFWALPNYGTVEKPTTITPLTTGEKFKIVAKGTFDPVEFAYIGMVAGINQADNTNPTFGQGLKGYAKRYGTAFTDNAVGNFMTGAVFPSMFHQDPRYYQMGKGSIFHRILYSGTRVLITRGDSGNPEFNFSEILGNAVAAGVSNAYHPPPRTLVSNISVWWTQIGWDAASAELKEFWPDIRRKLRPSKD